MTLTIGLVNNMPDAALAATERQFTGLLQAAARGRDVTVKLFSLPNVPRAEYARAQMRGRYGDLEALAVTPLDALIVTGTEPRAADLKAEPYFPALAWLADWAETRGICTIWSCLAAHAVVLHRDDIRRRPRAAKLSGVFACERASFNPLLANLPAAIDTPHSRQNDLAAEDLRKAGYEILTVSEDAGVDAFARHGRSLQLFLQGHPEYDADSLAREYLRDVGRYLKGERDVAPAIPAGYFAADVEADLQHLVALAERMPGHGLMSRFTNAVSTAAPAHRWRADAEQLYANWLDEVAARKAEPAPVAQVVNA
jgi:homoserine O-succinyltransferase